MLKTRLCAVVVVGLTACGSALVVRQPVSAIPTTTTYVIGNVTNAAPKDGDQLPAYFLGVVNHHLTSELWKNNRLAQPSEERVTLNERELVQTVAIDIKVVSYRMRSGFSRVMFGVMPGKDGIESEVTLRDVKTGAVLGSSTVSSFNVMAIGGQEDVAQMHGQEIGKFVMGSATQTR